MLSEFGTRVVAHGLEQRVLDLLLDALNTQGLVGAGGKARSDSTHVISAVRDLNRLELAGESVRAALEAVVVVAPDWLRRGDRRGGMESPLRRPYRHLAVADLDDQACRAGGTDVLVLLRAVGDSAAPPWLRELPAVDVLRRVLVQNYLVTTDAAGWEVIRAREAEQDGLPPGENTADLAL